MSYQAPTLVIGLVSPSKHSTGRGRLSGGLGIQPGAEATETDVSMGQLEAGFLVLVGAVQRVGQQHSGAGALVWRTGVSPERHAAAQRSHRVVLAGGQCHRAAGGLGRREQRLAAIGLRRLGQLGRGAAGGVEIVDG